MDKKNNIGTAIDLGMEDLSDSNKNNVEIANERYDSLHNNSDEGNIINTNERH